MQWLLNPLRQNDQIHYQDWNIHAFTHEKIIHDQYYQLILDQRSHVKDNSRNIIGHSWSWCCASKRLNYHLKRKMSSDFSELDEHGLWLKLNEELMIGLT